MLTQVRIGIGAADYWVRRLRRRDDMVSVVGDLLGAGEFSAYQRDRRGRTWLIIGADRLAWQVEVLVDLNVVAVHAVTDDRCCVHDWPNRLWDLSDHAGDRCRERLGSNAKTTALLTHEELGRIKRGRPLYQVRFGDMLLFSFDQVSYVAQLTDWGRIRVITAYQTTEVPSDLWRHAYGLGTFAAVGA